MPIAIRRDRRRRSKQALRDHLGVSQVLWLGEGVAGDDTDGHIDDISRFVSPTTIVTAVEEDPSSPNHEPLQENLRRLELARDPDGRAFDIVTLPMPGAVLAGDDPLPASYANFYIANGVVLLPVYGHANDARAADILQRLFPDRPRGRDQLRAAGVGHGRDPLRHAATAARLARSAAYC